MKKILTVLGITTLVLTGALVSTQQAAAYRGDPSAKGPNFSEERHEHMENAFENNDYDAWKNLMEGRGRVSQVVTEETFAKLAQAHELSEEGKFDKAKKIRQELGLGSHNGNGQGQAKRECMRN